MPINSLKFTSLLYLFFIFFFYFTGVLFNFAMAADLNGQGLMHVHKHKNLEGHRINALGM
jgi:hypothetical protein